MVRGEAVHLRLPAPLRAPDGGVDDRADDDGHRKRRDRLRELVARHHGDDPSTERGGDTGTRETAASQLPAITMPLEDPGLAS